MPVSVINGDKIHDTYALIDPGSTSTYVLDVIARYFNLKTGEPFDLDVQFMNLSRSFSVRPTSFTIAPYADNEKTFEVSHAFSTSHSNIPPAYPSELNEICQARPQLRHIKFSDINNGRIGVLLGTSCL